MRPLYLTLSAFGPYPEKERVDFTHFERNGFFLITGPTGSGKTTIFDGITYALFGAASTRVREKTSLRSDFAGEERETYAELIFWHKEKEYCIRRSPRYERKKKRGNGITVSNETAVLLEEGKRPLETVSEVNRRIEEILGLNYKQFKQLGMLAQGEFMELLLASSKDRAAIFRDLFQTGEYEELQRRLSEEAKRLRGRLMDLDSRMDEIFGQAGVKKEEGFPPEAQVLKIKELWGQAAQEKKEIEERLREEKKKWKGLEEKGTEYFKLEKELLKEKEKNIKQKQEWEVQKEKTKGQKAALTALEEELRQRKEKRKEEHRLLLEKRQDYQKRKKENAGWERELLETEGAWKEKKREEEELKEFLKEFSDFSKEQKKQKALMESYKRQQEKEEKARKRYLQKEELYRSAAIGLAARFLEDGKPCPVCGSLSHPKKAQVSEKVPDQQEVAEYRKQAETERELLDAVFAETQEGLGALRKREEDLKAGCQKRGIQDEENGKEKYRSLQAERERLFHLQKALKEKEKEARSLEKEWRTLEKALENFLQKKEKSQEKEEKELLKQRERLQKEEVREASKRAVFETGIKTEEILTQKQQTVIQRLDLDIDLLEKERREVLESLEDLEQRRDILIARQSRLKTAWDALKDRLTERRALEEKYGIWQDLDNVTRGRNKDRLVFEQDVLAVYFEEVLEAANTRFSLMTGGRYELRKIRRVEDARTTNSLDIEVFDQYTGKCRQVRSLSGGEAFKAALCLAMGMADMVEASIGGIRMDTLFIDEGFGSLDEESLDQALKSLLSLTGQKYFVGIISHVSELKERIEQQIIIEKRRNGSHICKIQRKNY